MAVRLNTLIFLFFNSVHFVIVVCLLSTSWWGVALYAVPFLCIDLAFLASNVYKVSEGGWLPIVIAVFVGAIMGIWRRGRMLLQKHMRHE